MSDDEERPEDGTAGGEAYVTEEDMEGSIPSWSDIAPEWITNLKLALFAMAAGTGYTVKKIKEDGDMQEEMADLLAENPTEFITDVVVNAVAGFIYDSVLEPFARTVWDTGIAFLDAGIVVAFGTDRAIGVEDGSVYGLLDIPFVILSPAVGFIANLTTTATTSVESVNSSVAQVIGAQFPIMGPVVYGGFWAFEISAAAWLAWLALNTIDIPLVRVSGALRTASSPARRLFRWLL